MNLKSIEQTIKDILQKNKGGALSHTEFLKNFRQYYKQSPELAIKYTKSIFKQISDQEKIYLYANDEVGNLILKTSGGLYNNFIKELKNTYTPPISIS